MTVAIGIWSSRPEYFTSSLPVCPNRKGNRATRRQTHSRSVKSRTGHLAD